MPLPCRHETQPPFHPPAGIRLRFGGVVFCDDVLPRKAASVQACPFGPACGRIPSRQRRTRLVQFALTSVNLWQDLSGLCLDAWELCGKIQCNQRNLIHLRFCLFCLHHGLIGLRDFADFHVILTSNKHQSNKQIYGQHSVGGIGHGNQNEFVAS